VSDTLRVAIRKFGPFESAIPTQYADFQVATGCSLRLEPVALDLNPLFETLFTRGGLKDGTWDIAFVVTDWMAEAVAEGALLDLTPRMREQPVPDYPTGWAPSLTRFQSFGEAIYGLPYHDGPECLVYRRDLFADPAVQAAFAEQHGRQLAVPRTWDEFTAVARFFTRPEAGQWGAIFAGYPDGHNTVYDFCLQLWSRDGALTDAAGVPTLDTPAAVAALDFYRRLVNDRTATPPGQEEVDSVKSGERFAAGEIAMMVNWFGFAAVCEQPGTPVRGKVDVAPVPAGPGGRAVSLNVYWLLAVGAGSRHQDEAYAFIRHACGAAMDKLLTLEGGIGCRRSTWSDPEVNAAIPFMRRLDELHAPARELPRSQTWPRLVQIIDAAVQKAIKSDASTEAILREAQTLTAGMRL
jgi:multiple sugar transport system substrate-binding protein